MRSESIEQIKTGKGGLSTLKSGTVGGTHTMPGINENSKKIKKDKKKTRKDLLYGKGSNSKAAVNTNNQQNIEEAEEGVLIEDNSFANATFDLNNFDLND